MKSFALLFLALGCAFGQAVYIEPPPALTVSGSPPSGSFPAVLAASGARVSLCSYPSCASLTQTYTDATAGTPCPTNAQAVIAGTSTCTNAADVRGNFGFWVLTGGQYQYKITLRNGVVYGPFPVTMQTNNAANVQVIGLDSQPHTVQNLTDPVYGDSLIATQQAITGSVSRSVRSKNSDTVSVKDFGAAGDGTTDDTTAITKAVAWMLASGGTVFFPCGTYKATAAITIYTGLTNFLPAGGIRGDGDSCTNVKVSPGSLASAAVTVASDATGANWVYGFHMEDITITGSANTTYAFTGLRLTQPHFQNVTFGGAEPTAGACAYFKTTVAGTYDRLVCDPNHIGGWPSGAEPHNGIIFDGFGFGDGSYQNTIINPTIQQVAGDALSIIGQSGKNVVTAAQIAGAGRTVVVAGSGNSFVSCLFEDGAGSPDGAAIAGDGNTFIASEFSGSGALHITGGRENVFSSGTLLPLTIHIDSGVVHARFDGYRSNSLLTVTDNSADTEWGSAYQYDAGQPPINVPLYRRSYPVTTSSGGGDLPTVIEGTWISSGAALNILPTKYATGKAWRAVFIGKWLTASSFADPQIVTLSDDHPAFALFGSTTVTFGVSGGGLFQMTTAASAGFSGTIHFFPSSAAAGAGAGGTDAMFELVLAQKFQAVGLNFASLGTPANGILRYCQDCKSVGDGATAGLVCAGSGTGAFARREGGVWRCN